MDIFIDATSTVGITWMIHRIRSNPEIERISFWDQLGAMGLAYFSFVEGKDAMENAFV